VGSNILNVLIILGLSATIVPLAVRKISLILDIPMVLFATVLLFVLGLFGSINFIGGIILLLIFIGYMAILFINAKKPKKPGELEEEDAPIKVMPVWKSIIFIVLGLGMIVLGSDVTVDSATALARIFGVSERFIALTIVALGTSLPELFTSVNAAIKGNADIAVGNILGSCIFNILFILGLTSLIIPVPFESKFLIDTIVAFVAVLLILLFSLKSKKLARWAGIVMLVAYAGYFVYLLLV
jgi:cation:H+ antiporter